MSVFLFAMSVHHCLTVGYEFTEMYHFFWFLTAVCPMTFIKHNSSRHNTLRGKDVVGVGLLLLLLPWCCKVDLAVP